MKRKKCFLKLVCVMLCVTILTGCKASSMKIVFTMGMNSKEIFQIGSATCTTQETYILLATLQKQYEKVFGEDMWTKDFGGLTIEEYLKGTVISQMEQMYCINLMGESRNIVLTEQEKALAQKAAEEFFEELPDDLKKQFKVDQKTVEKLYAKYALAEKVYAKLTQDVNSEISDDEARIIKVQDILLKTYSEKDGEKKQLSEEKKEEKRLLAEQIAQRAAQGEDFTSLAKEYNEDTVLEYSFGRDELEESLEKVIFDMEAGEISQVTESQYGYHIIKCISSFEQEETDANKKILLEKRKEEAFQKLYDEFTNSTTYAFHDKAWKNVTLLEDASQMISFYDIYDRYFQDIEWADEET